MGLEKEGERTSFLLPLQESFSHPRLATMLELCSQHLLFPDTLSTTFFPLCVWGLNWPEGMKARS